MVPVSCPVTVSSLRPKDTTRREREREREKGGGLGVEAATGGSMEESDDIGNREVVVGGCGCRAPAGQGYLAPINNERRKKKTTTTTAATKTKTGKERKKKKKREEEGEEAGK